MTGPVTDPGTPPRKVPTKGSILFIERDIDHELSDRLVRQIRACPEDVELKISINSPGGGMFEGLAIYNAILVREGPTRIFVNGIASGAAAIICLAGPLDMDAEAHIAFLEPKFFGLVDTSTEPLKQLDKIRATVKDILGAKVGNDKAGQLIAGETWLTKADAQELGLLA